MNTKENQEIWIEKVHENLKLRGRSELTFNNYKSALKKFFNFYSSDQDIQNFSEEDIIPYLNENFIKTNKSKYTYNLAVSSIRLFYLICVKKSFNRTLLPTSKTPTTLPTIMPKEKFILIINKESYLKHKCWLLLAFCCGLRVHEVAKVKVDDLNSKEHKLKVRGKNDKERYTILPDIVIKFLGLYCKEHNIRCGYLFPGFNNEFMNEKSIINYFSELKEKYKLNENISFHSLRHSFATYYLMNGGDLLVLKNMMGHKSLTTTSIYVHLSQDFNNLKGIDYAK